MEDAAELGNYLPLSFKSPKEQEYIEFLWDAFETNYTGNRDRYYFLGAKNCGLACAGTDRKERALVEANWKLVEIFEKKIQSKLVKVWGAGE